MCCCMRLKIHRFVEMVWRAVLDLAITRHAASILLFHISRGVGGNAPDQYLDLSICVLLCVPQSFHREDIILRKETKCIKFLENIRYVVAQRVIHSFLFLDV